jgi:hypothetical protein
MAGFQRPHNKRINADRVVVPLATVEVGGTHTVEVAGAHTAALESASLSRKVRGRSDRACRAAPCRRERPGVRAEPSSRTGIPLLRSPDGAKGGEVVEFAVACHVGPPLNRLAGRPGEGSGASAGSSLPRVRPTATDLAFGRKGGPAADARPPARQPGPSGVRKESRRQDFRDSRPFAPGQLHRPVAAGPPGKPPLSRR